MFKIGVSAQMLLKTSFFFFEITINLQGLKAVRRICVEKGSLLSVREYSKMEIQRQLPYLKSTTEPKKRSEKIKLEKRLKLNKQ